MSALRRALVTGASGFIGRAVCAALREMGVTVIGIDRLPDPDLGVVAGDTVQPRSWSHLADGCDVVVHTAAVVSNAVGLDEQWRVNVLGTRRVLDVAVAAGVPRVVHLSSVRAFSDTMFADGVTEDSPVRPDGNPYVEAKIASEHVALQAHAAGELDVVVVRPGDVYGPGSQPWILTPLALIRAGQFVLPARGAGIFSPVFVDDLVRGVLLAAQHPAAPGQIFTIGGGAAVRCSEFFGHLVAFAGRRGPVVLPTAMVLPLAMALDGVSRLAGRRTEANVISMRYLTRTGTYSIDKARRILGYEPEVSLEEGMRRTEAWLLSEGLISARAAGTR